MSSERQITVARLGWQLVASWQVSVRSRSPFIHSHLSETNLVERWIFGRNACLFAKNAAIRTQFVHYQDLFLFTLTLCTFYRLCNSINKRIINNNRPPSWSSGILGDEKQVHYKSWPKELNGTHIKSSTQLSMMQALVCFSRNLRVGIVHSNLWRLHNTDFHFYIW